MTTTMGSISRAPPRSPARTTSCALLVTSAGFVMPLSWSRRTASTSDLRIGSAVRSCTVDRSRARSAEAATPSTVFTVDAVK